MLVDMQKTIDPEMQAKALQQAADETNKALSTANEALQSGQVTLELTKGNEPLITHMKAVFSAKLELIAFFRDPPRLLDKPHLKSWS